MPKLTINGKKLKIDKNLTILQACRTIGIEIPHFCFHERLKIAGNCRMCLVEVEKFTKPVASCATQVNEGMVVNTNTPNVLRAREGVMEFLLINHPLDCPICDQGGECDLQDQAYKYGRGQSRYSEYKRSVKDKSLGPLIETHMTRCIHCTRCIRFASDIAGIQEIGSVGRGEDMEIVSYLERTLTSELSGNIIDLCPVGALNSKPYAFSSRSWELKATDSIDIMDAVGSNIRIDSKSSEVMRILPRLNEDINEEWLSDKARFSYDGLKNQRLDRPYVKKNGKLKAVTWDIALSHITDKFNSLQYKSSVAAIAGTLSSCETIFLLKNLLSNLGSEMYDANQFNYRFDLSSRGNYLFNTTISGIEKADICLLVGTNPKQVSPVLNARIGKMVRSGLLVVGRIGEEDNQSYKITELGKNIEVLEYFNMEKPKHAKHTNESINCFIKLLSHACNPMIIVGDQVLKRIDSHAILSILHKTIQKYQIIRNGWNGFNILHGHASTVGALDLGFTYGKSGDGVNKILEKTQNGDVKILYLLGSDDIDMDRIKKDVFVIYQGHHGDSGANRADVILPEAAYTEQNSIYVNMEGRPQYTKAAVPPPGSAKTGIEIINAVANALGIRLISDKLHLIRKEMARQNQVFNFIDKIVPSKFIEFKSKTKLIKKPLEKVSINYYMTDPISRSSLTMAKCTKATQELVVAKLENRFM